MFDSSLLFTYLRRNTLKKMKTTWRQIIFKYYSVDWFFICFDSAISIEVGYICRLLLCFLFFYWPLCVMTFLFIDVRFFSPSAISAESTDWQIHFCNHILVLLLCNSCTNIYIYQERLFCFSYLFYRCKIQSINSKISPLKFSLKSSIIFQ